MEAFCCIFSWPFRICCGSITSFLTSPEVADPSVSHHVLFSLPQVPSLLLVSSPESPTSLQCAVGIALGKIVPSPCISCITHPCSNTSITLHLPSHKSLTPCSSCPQPGQKSGLHVQYMHRTCTCTVVPKFGFGNATLET